MTEILLGVVVFTGLVLALSLVVLAARRLLMPRGLAHVTVNRSRVIDAEIGERLLAALNHGGIHLPTSCGGVGTCGLCRVELPGGGALPTERATLGETAVAQGMRLACQVTVREDMAITVAEDLLAAERWDCEVLSARFLAPLIREIRLSLPAGAARVFRAGSYVQVTAPPYALRYADIPVEADYEAAWQRMDIRGYEAGSPVPVTRAYSLANRPEETDSLLLNIRLALPPPGKPQAPPGIVSSWLFGLRPGDRVAVSGPYGNFFAADSEREMVLVGGGVGMAPLYAHVHEQLEARKSDRRIGFWYGARALADLYYHDEMERLASEHENFSWHLALSDPAPEDGWQGETGFIHDVLYRSYLKDHADPRACAYYLCGPPLMIEAVQGLLARLGVAEEDIHYDDFGG